MTHKRRIRTRLLGALRRIGWLCKKITSPKRRIRISKTVYPNGSVEVHGIITKAPENKHSLESEIHVYNEIKKEFRKYNKPK